MHFHFLLTISCVYVSHYQILMPMWKGWCNSSGFRGRRVDRSEWSPLPKRIGKSCALFSNRSFFVLSIFKNKSDTNLCHQSLIAFTNTYEVTISVVIHRWRSLHPNVTNMRYSKGRVPYEGEYIVCFLCEPYQKLNLSWFQHIIQMKPH